MPYSLDDFCKDARTILKADSGPAGVEKVKGNMERLIKDGDFIKQYFRADVLIRSGKERSEHRSKP